MFHRVKNVKYFLLINGRTFRNFGHKREPESTFTILWHGFLTFTFIGCGVNWKKIGKFFEGQELDEESKQRLENFMSNK